MKALKWAIIALGFLPSGATAQQAPSNASAPTPIFIPNPVTVPLPPEGCVWAGRAYSQGAQFCLGVRTGLKCTASKWDAVTTEACAGASAIDTK
jgi:hypothetical protein